MWERWITVWVCRYWIRIIRLRRASWFPRICPVDQTHYHWPWAHYVASSFSLSQCGSLPLYFLKRENFRSQRICVILFVALCPSSVLTYCWLLIDFNPLQINPAVLQLFGYSWSRRQILGVALIECSKTSIVKLWFLGNSDSLIQCVPRLFLPKIETIGRPNHKPNIFSN